MLDEQALLTCMVYVDLNPIRAAMARTTESSDYTSIQERIKSKKSNLLNLGFDEDDIPYNLTDYLDLVDFTGRAILANKKGFIMRIIPDTCIMQMCITKAIELYYSMAIE